VPHAPLGPSARGAPARATLPGECRAKCPVPQRTETRTRGLGGCPPNPPSGSAAPVLTPRRPLSFRQVSKDFKDFVTAIGECKSKQEEDRIIMKEM
jgi:hypothetical protein